MNSRERVKAALDHRQPDRVPFGEWGVDHDVVEAVLGRETFWRNRRKCTLATWAGERDEMVESWKRDLADLVKALDYDLVPVMLVPGKDIQPAPIKQVDAETWESEDGHIYKYTHGNDAILCINHKATPAVSSVDEYLERLTAGAGDGFRCRSYDPGKGFELELEDPSVLELVEHVVKELGGERFVFYRGVSVFNIPHFGGGMEEFFLKIAMEPELVKECFEIYTDYETAVLQEIYGTGVDAVMPGGDYSDSNGPMISPEAVRRIFLPGMKKLTQAIRSHGLRTMMHNCGNNIPLMDLMIEAGFEAWQSIQAVLPALDMGRLKRDYGNRIALWGGINIEHLHDASPETNRKDVLYAIEQAGRGGGFILGTSNSVSYGSRYDNYMAAVDAWREGRERWS
ncbi:MAG: hypothetical protein JW909_01930 [Planctomycetes bacterium]|nr:hypothetical protein [Planctomycetota bacterium]